MQLILEDGTAFAGEPIGATTGVAGEVVFNTAVAGYVESLTDPSYCGQILVFAYPLIGNYGVPNNKGLEMLDARFESARAQVQGVVVQTCSHLPSHHESVATLSDWLESEGVPGISGVDTRALTIKLREHGTMRGELRAADYQGDLGEVEMGTEVFRRVPGPATDHNPQGSPHIVVVDVGVKRSIVASLVKRGARVSTVPWFDDFESVAKSADGLLISNGPGDPADLQGLTDRIRTLLTAELPTLGICLGHQLLCLASGAKTYKLKYGHRGINQPVQDLISRQCFVTSQNHGYAVDEASLPAEWEPWFININDGTNEGVRAKTKPWLSVQFHPEAAPGPQDAGPIFDEFLRLVGVNKMRRG